MLIKIICSVLVVLTGVVISQKCKYPDPKNIKIPGRDQRSYFECGSSGSYVEKKCASTQRFDPGKMDCIGSKNPTNSRAHQELIRRVKARNNNSKDKINEGKDEDDKLDDFNRECKYSGIFKVRMAARAKNAYYECHQTGLYLKKYCDPNTNYDTIDKVCKGVNGLFVSMSNLILCLIVAVVIRI